MAKSNSRKQRDKLIQQGKNDPSMMRGSWGGIKPTPRIKQGKNKYEYNWKKEAI